MNKQEEYFEANKKLWNQRTAIHKDSSFYDLAGFKAGKNVLTPIEINEMGNVQGKKMLHLQCHFGMDSLDWARRGADVTGVDLSDVAIIEAKRLSDELKMNAKFICANIYELHPEVAESKAPSAGWRRFGKAAFDIVFTSYGTIGWLPDLDKWADIIAHYLKPGGIFYIADFHPVLWMFDDDFAHIKYAYDNQEVIITESQGTYTNREADIKTTEYGWNHSLSEILNALINKGLTIQNFNEYMYAPYACFNNSVEFEKGKWHIKGLEGKIPMVYSILAKKK